LKRDAELDDADADERVKILETRMKEAQEKQAVALADKAAEDSSDLDVDAVSKEGNLDIEKVRQEVAELEAEKAEASKKADPGFWKKALVAGTDRSQKEAKERMKTLPGELDAKRKELAEMEAVSGAGAQTGKALESDSEIARLEARLALHKQVEAARQAEMDAAEKVDSTSDVDEDDDEAVKAAADARNKLEMARASARAMEALQKKHGGFEEPKDVQDAEVQVKRLRSDRDDNASGKKVYEAERALEKAQKDRENEIARVRIDAESAVAALKSKGIDAEEKALGFAREKLELAREQKGFGDAEYEAQLKILKARGEAMRENAKERKESLTSSLVEKSLRRKSEDAKRDGDQGRSKRLREEADKVRDSQRERELTKEAEGVTSDPAQIKKYVDAVMAEEKTARAGQRKRDEGEAALGRRRTRAQGEGGLESAILRGKGKGREADRMEEGRQRELDEIKRVELQKKYRKDGFGDDEADKLANRDVKVGQAQRGIDALKAQGGSGHVVASSLASIGGGGRVAGRDPNTKILEKMEALLKEIRDGDKEDVTNVF
jgi:hypothetical protein